MHTHAPFLNGTTFLSRFDSLQASFIPLEVGVLPFALCSPCLDDRSHLPNFVGVASEVVNYRVQLVRAEGGCCAA